MKSSNGVFMLEMAILAYVSAVSLPKIPVFITSMAFRIARASAENIEQSLGSLKVSIIAIPTPLHDFEASAVSSFRLRLELSHLKVVDLIWFNLVFWLFQDMCHFFLIYVMKSSNGVFMLEMAVLAYVSAVSLPEIPVCPVIHVTSSILFWMRMAMSPGWVLFLTLFMALRKSLRIKKLVCGKVFITSIAFRISRASAENIEQSLRSLKDSIITISTPLHDFEASSSKIP
ncbi:Uncharacterized protein FWK35_00007385 [Aphis craccivora]|uniref:Uncharacterized protein n=1 Tax=Aphis craccivora TaxID=307492 RepID=A0A6G0YF66_APHCR|nr:Uncharacterized protein FWK35_00007385 [Aphis craccivora]